MKKSEKREGQLLREVWAASISLRGLWPEQTIEGRLNKIFARMENVYSYEPDIICLPEIFPISWVDEPVTLAEIAESETIPGPITSMVAKIAKNQNCYIVCPVITEKEGHFFNSAILINRKGKIQGVYNKAHPVDIEILPDKVFRGGGTIPGTLEPPVFKTDFGIIGIQICFDASYFDTWRTLKEQGAEMVLFPSQGPFGDILSFHAWMNQYAIVSSTGEDARIIDMTGDVIASDGEFERWACAPVNLERQLVRLWPYVKKFDQIRKKYGKKVSIKIYHAENWATIESLDPELKISALLSEFEIPNYEDELKELTAIQNSIRL